MALVKTSKISGSKAAASPLPPAATVAAKVKPPVRRRTTAVSGVDKVAERVAAATEELASGLAEASAAAEELRRSMEQIASGAEEAAGASQEQLTAIKSVVGNLNVARGQAEASRRRTEAVQLILGDAAVQITISVRAIERNAARQAASVEIIGELERRAQDIGEITRTVSQISDQTNLLALNAAIEAARAGDHGRGFAVVAEEVRALAEASEKSAQDVQSLAGAIQADVRGVVAAVTTAVETARAEAKSGVAVVDGLGAARADMARLAGGSEEILTAALEAERSAIEAQKGAEQVATAAEEQSAAAAEAQTAIGQQAQSLDQGQTAAQSLATLAEGLRTGQATGAATAEIGATAEELSATIQELSSAAGQIMTAVEQINRGSGLQAAAAQQTSAALAQIEQSARISEENASQANAKVQAVGATLTEGRAAVQRLVEGVSAALEDTRTSLTTISRLETVGRRIEKIVDAITLVTVQTSMLAVSGSVEAARAGDSGRGFAVVSHDIRNLARDASESVDKVKDTVRGILDQIASLRRDLEQIITTAEVEVQNNRTIFAALEQVDADLAAVSAGNEAILQGAKAMLSATAQTAEGARQIAAAAEQASSASRQAATASSQQARGAEDLAAAIEEIASLADELTQQNG